MDLVERYLAAIGRELPAAQQDVVAELRDVLLSQVEEAEARFGRPLMEAEVEALLAAFGHPLVVAGRYRPIQHLVGPEVFPFWWAGLKASLAIACAVWLVLFFVRVVTGDGQVGTWNIFPGLWSTGLSVFAIVTLVAVGLEQSGGIRFLTHWRAANLPPIGVKPRSQFELVVEIGMGLVFLLWWVGAIHFRDFIPDRAQLAVAPAPVWADWFWPILGYAVADLVINVVALTRSGWRRTVAGLAFARHLAGAAILLGVLQAGRWVIVSGVRPAAELAELQQSFDLAGRVAIVALIAVMAVKAAAELWRFARPQGVAWPSARRLTLSL